MTRLAIVIPIYNEHAVLPTVLLELIQVSCSIREIDGIDLVVVDDASTDGSVAQLEAAWYTWLNQVAIANLLTLHVLQHRCNQGHQRAVLSGLRYVQGLTWDSCLIMDGDGQDDPHALSAMLAPLATGLDAVFARRSSRAEGWRWVIGYQIYQAIFRLLLGQGLPLGNFCLLSRGVVERLSKEGDLMHLAATVATYPVRRCEVPVARRARSGGVTKMRPWGLVDYGVAAMTASAQAWLRLFTRLSVLTAAVATGGLCFVIAIRLFTDLAIAGWASTICLLTFGLSLQAMGFMATTAFLCRILQQLAPVRVEAAVRVLRATAVTLAAREIA